MRDGDVGPADWFYVLLLAVFFVGAFAVVANSCERIALCEERGGVMVRGVCLRADALEDLR